MKAFFKEEFEFAAILWKNLFFGENFNYADLVFLLCFTIDTQFCL